MAADLTSQILSIIRSYERVGKKRVAQISKQTAKECARKLNEASEIFDANITDIPYAGSWYATEFKMGYTVHSRIPGLPHLLENGHELYVHGEHVGYVPGIPHIKPVAEECAEEYEQRMRDAWGSTL